VSEGPLVGHSNVIESLPNQPVPLRTVPVVRPESIEIARSGFLNEADRPVNRTLVDVVRDGPTGFSGGSGPVVHSTPVALDTSTPLDVPRTLDPVRRTHTRSDPSTGSRLPPHLRPPPLGTDDQRLTAGELADDYAVHRPKRQRVARVPNIDPSFIPTVSGQQLLAASGPNWKNARSVLLRDPSSDDRMFTQERLRFLEQTTGTKVVWGTCANPDGSNALTGQYFSMKNSFFLKAAKDLPQGYGFMNPPYSKIGAFVDHWVTCKQQNPELAGFLALPFRPYAGWFRQIAHLPVVQYFHPGVELFNQPDSSGVGRGYPNLKFVSNPCGKGG